MRFRAKVDDNQRDLVAALRSFGCTVLPLHQLGHGVPDLLVRRPDGSLALVEVKDGSKPPSARKLTPDEQQFAAQWRGVYYLVSTLQQAAELADNQLEAYNE